MKFTDRFPLETFQGLPSNDWFVCAKTGGVAAKESRSNMRKSRSADFQSAVSPTSVGNRLQGPAHGDAGHSVGRVLILNLSAMSDLPADHDSGT